MTKNSAQYSPCGNSKIVIIPFVVAAFGFWSLFILPISLVPDQHLTLKQIFMIVCFRLCLFYWFFHTVGYWFYRLLPLHSFAGLPQVDDTDQHPLVAVVVPIRDEPTSVIQRMLSALVEIEYSSYEVILVDNSSTPLELPNCTLAKAKDLRIQVLRKQDTVGFKAGALNHALKHISTDIRFVLVLDVDHAPHPKILKSLVPVLQKNQKLAFVQTPQRFIMGENRLLYAASNFQQRVFYDHCCPGMAIIGSLFLTGTNVLIRKESLEEIGGFDESTLTEDLGTSLNFHLKGWHGAYVKETLAMGYAPHDLPSYHRQQRRWAIGTFQCMAAAWKMFMQFPSKMKVGQWLQYLGFTGTWYFQGVVNTYLAWSSLWFLISGFRPPLGPLDIVPIALIIVTILYQIIDERRVMGTPYIQLIMSQAVYFGNSLVFLKAFADFLLKRNQVFEVTNKSRVVVQGVSRSYLVYHFLYIIVFLFAFCMAFRNGSFMPLTFLLWPTLFAFQSIMNLSPRLYSHHRAEGDHR